MIKEKVRSATSARVLVIDDEATIREWLVRGLPDRGYAAEAASHAEEALEKIGRQRFDLIICDIRMPGEGGVDLLKDIKRMHPDIEVIMATGYGTVDTALESMKRGAYDYITKPFSIDQVCAILDAALAIQQSKKAALRLRKNKSTLGRFWLLPIGFLLLGGINLVWKMAAPPEPPLWLPSMFRQERRIAKTITPAQVPLPFAPSKRIPQEDAAIARCDYSYPMIQPGETLEFDIHGSRFSEKFVQMLQVKSGTPEVGLRDVQWVTANQIHGRLTATAQAATQYLRPAFFIHDRAIFQTHSPFAVIRPGEVLDMFLVKAEDTGRSGKYRIYANLDPSMAKQLRLTPSSPELVLSVPHPVSTYVWEGAVQLKKIAPGYYGVKVYIGDRQIYKNDTLIQTVKPSSSGSSGSPRRQ